MQTFVAAVFPQHVAIQNPSAQLARELPELGSAAGGGEALLPCSSSEQLAAVMTRLQLLAVPFVASGPGWHPAAVFEQLREQGLVSGTISTIVWTSPGQSELGEA